ncbi:MAG TPA: protein-methionine-sulfoxide reductase catalytic subunit MsrP, partial [Alphaproteobacteria bacterium]|nr:protein-methionine-sulfoxide reductase catalytic subunit MsrP [Alphaproteobacteria bacterium]
MLIRSIRNWEIPEREATPEAHYLNRRRFFTLAGATSLLAACEQAAAPVAQPPDLTSGLYPATRNEAYTLDRPITAESLTSRYNNFYE